MTLKKKIEALLFSSARRMTIKEISEFTKSNNEEVLKNLKELQTEMIARDSSITLMNEDDTWKMIVRHEYGDVAKSVISETELDKSLTETLAVIAWKYPVTQSEVIKIRHNKAYDHIKLLREMGFIAKEKEGRTYKLKLTPKFFQYFDLPDKHAKEALSEILPKETLQKLKTQEKEIQQTEKEKEILQEKQKQQQILPPEE